MPANLLRSFHTRILALVLGLVTAVLAAIVTAVVVKERGEVSRDAAQQLRAAADTAREILKFRGEQLSGAVDVLTSDFGFKEAVSSGDSPTLLSAMANHGARIGADVLIVLDPNGQLLTSTLPRLSPATLADLRELAAGDADGQMLRLYRLIDGRPYQLVLAPVRAPVPIAWTAMGFALDDRVAGQMARLLGVEVSFVVGGGGDAGPSFIASSLPVARRSAVAQAVRQPFSAPFSIQDGADEYLSWTRSFHSANGSLNLVLQRSLTAALRPFVELRNSIVAVGLVILVSASVLAVLLSRGATRPVDDLTRAAERLEAGDYEASVPEASTAELSRLARAFNTMRLAISEREGTIRYQASHDKLTGLPSRARLIELLERALSAARAQTSPVAVCLVEIQQLQDIIGSFGHATADKVVCEMARRLTEASGAEAIIARISTDQLVVVIQGLGTSEVARHAEELGARLRLPLDYGAVSLQPDNRIGVSVFPDDAERADELLQRADLALYRAKESGAPVGTFVRGDDELQRQRLSMLGDLRRAISADELELHYQPKVLLPSGKAVGCEALVRWRHPSRGLVPPAEFIGYAERAGLINSITVWVLRASFRQSRAWESAGMKLDVSVNVSPVDLADAAFADTVATLLADSGADANRIVLEVTEGAAMKDLAKTVRIMNRLRTLGVRFSIDDFGTGYSSLAHLERLPVSELKIDRSFIKDLEARQDEDVIVRSTIDLGHALGLKVVAEGVEKLYSWNALAGLGCDLVQGYYVAPPIPEPEFTAWVADRIMVDLPDTVVEGPAEHQELPSTRRFAG